MNDCRTNVAKVSKKRVEKWSIHLKNQIVSKNALQRCFEVMKKVKHNSTTLFWNWNLSKKRVPPVIAALWCTRVFIFQGNNHLCTKNIWLSPILSMVHVNWELFWNRFVTIANDRIFPKRFRNSPSRKKNFWSHVQRDRTDIYPRPRPFLRLSLLTHDICRRVAKMYDIA